MPVFKIQKGAGAAALGDSMKSALEITNQLEQQKVRNDQAQQRIDLAKQGAADAVFDRSERIRMQEKSYEFDSTQAKQKELMRQESEDEARANYDAEVVNFYGIDSPEAKAYQELDHTEPAYHQERHEVGQKIKAKKRETQLRGVRSKIAQMFTDDPSDPVIKNLKLQLDENAPIEDLVEEGNARYETWSADNAARVTGQELVADWRLGIPHAELGDLKPEMIKKINLYESISAGDPNSPMLEELGEEIMSEISPNHMRKGRRKLQDEKDAMLEARAVTDEFEEAVPEIRGALVAPGTPSLHPNQITYLSPEEKAGAMHVAFRYMGEWGVMMNAANPDWTRFEFDRQMVNEADHIGLKFKDFNDLDAWLKGKGESPPEAVPEKPRPEGELDPNRKGNKIWPYSADDFEEGDSPLDYIGRKVGGAAGAAFSTWKDATGFFEETEKNK
ncbi:MAG: hypothetical protein OSB57_04210 [Planctomycetota bacterium]|nr:hypothetical protein [Planctomycetota bacterium]